MPRLTNLYAGPAGFPQSVLEKIHQSLFEYKDTGISPMELFHRSPDFQDLFDEVTQKCKEILHIPSNYSVLFMEGGATLQFSLVPLNLLHLNKKAGYIITDHWGQLAMSEANKVKGFKTELIFDSAPTFEKVCFKEDLKPIHEKDYAYIHLTSNNTICGSQFHKLPSFKEVPLVIDATSDIASRHFDFKKDNIGILFASCQKNLGLAGLTLVIVRDDLIAESDELNPVVSYSTHKKRGITHTPPVFNVYILGLMLDYIKESGGIDYFEKKSQTISGMLYDVIDTYPDFYRNVIQKNSRSRINIALTLKTPELENEFIKKALDKGFVGIKGYRLKGGIRLSLYNSLEVSKAEKLRDFMIEFKKDHH